jgi:hypothetical protein
MATARNVKPSWNILYLAQSNSKLDALFHREQSQSRRHPKTGSPRSTEHMDAIRALLANDIYLS